MSSEELNIFERRCHRQASAPHVAGARTRDHFHAGEQVFVHAAWAPDEDEATPGQGEAEEVVQQQKHHETEDAGFRKYGERVGALHERAASLPPPEWWQDVTDSQLAVGFGGGAAAARVHALLSPLWWVDMSPNNKALVVVRDSGMTLFSASDEFSSPRADWEGLPVSGERGFQWRRVAWSLDGSVLAVSEANGSATILSVNTFRATARISTLLPTRAPTVAIAFLQVHASDSASPVHALLALSYDGVLYTHPVATVQRTKDGPLVAVAEPLDLSSYHSNVTCLTVSSSTSMIAVGGWDLPSGASSQAAPSVSVWKASSDGNSYSFQFATGSSRGGAGAKSSTVSRVIDTLRAASTRCQWRLDPAILKLTFDAKGRMLVALEVSGTISVIDCVAQKLVHRFLPQSIPSPDPDGGSAPPTFDGRSNWWLASVGDVSWWDDSSVVLSRRNGLVTVNCINTGLSNVLKAPLGPFHYQPVVTNAISSVEGSMFVLDCRRRISTKSSEGGEEVGASFGASDNMSWLYRMLSGGAGDKAKEGSGDKVGSCERFVRRYRLISVCKTTVDRLFQRKLDLRDYPAALKVATKHSLSVDRVYQRQWELSDVSEQSIQEFLAKVTDRRWVIEECRSRLPRSREGAHLLSKYGIERCEAALADTSELDDSETTTHIERCREVLSRRIDWLEIYELIYPGDMLDPARLKWFCESDYTQVARLLALEEECHALAVLLKRYRHQLAPNWLEILACIPETCRPRQYEQLLPSCHEGGGTGDNGDTEEVVPVVEAAEWYVRRAQEIERRTGLVDNALELLELGAQRLRTAAPLPQLSGLRADLSHLYMLVYECGMEDLTLETWHAKSLMHRLCCFTDKSTTATFVSNLRDRAGPYLAALGSGTGEALLHDYLADIASSRLDWCAEVFKGSTIQEPLYTFATSNPASSTGRVWKRVVPAHYASWASTPPDNVQGQIEDDVIIVKFERDVPVREQVVLWAGSAAGTRAGVMVVVCSNDKEVQTVTTLKDPPPPGAKEGGETNKDDADKVDTEALGPRPKIPVCAVVVELSVGHTRARVCRHRVLHDPVTMVDVALRCVYACSTMDEMTVKAMGDIYCTLPTRDAKQVGNVADVKRYQLLQDRADKFDKHLIAIEILQKYKVFKPLSFFEDAASDPDACLAVMKAMCRFQVRQEKRSESGFRELHRDLMGPANPPADYGGLIHSVFSFLEPGSCNVIFLEALLDANFFDLSREVLEVEIEREEEECTKGEASSAYSSLASCVTVILKVAREYFDSASSCRDGVWHNARQCLRLIPLNEEEEEEDNEREATSADSHEGVRKQWQQDLRREHRLIEAVEMLDSLGLDPLPVQIRQAKDPFAIISRAMEQAPAMLRKHDDLLRLGRLLGLTARDDQHRIMELITRALVVASDATLPSTDKQKQKDSINLTEAAPLLTKLMGAGWGKVWDLCERLASEECSALRDDERLAFAAHALAHCPQKHSQMILATWQALRDKTHLSCHGGTPKDAPSVAVWVGGEDIGDGSEVWARAPKHFPVLHGFYTSHVPATVYTPLDPYFQQMFDDQDLHARAVEEALLEGATALAAMQKMGQSGSEGGAPVLWQRFAAAAAQGDAVLLLAVMFASSSTDLVLVFHHILKSQVAALGDQINCANVAKLEATAWLACVACHCLHSASKGDTVPSPCSAEVWAAACKALAHDANDEKSGGVRASLREAFANVSKVLGGAGGGGGNGKGGSSSANAEVAWATLLEYFKIVRLALTDMRDVAMEWSVRAACDPSSDPAALLRMALDAKVVPKADAVLASAAVLHKWMPLDEISDSAVQAALSARQLVTPRASGGVGGSRTSCSGGKEAESVLKDSSPAQRLKVAKELIDSGKAAPSLVREVLASVDADNCQDNTVKQEAKRLMSLMDEACDTERRANFDLVMAALEKERGGSKSEDSSEVSLGCKPAALHEFVAKRADEKVKADELLVLAQMVCFWDSAAMPWCLYTLAEGVAARSGSSSSDTRACNREALEASVRSGSNGGSVLGRDLASDETVSSGVAATWMLLLQRALALRFVSCALVLRCGPARYALTHSQEDELLTVAKGVSASTAAHFALLSPYSAVRGRAAELLVAGGDEEGEKEEEGVKWLVETALRCSALNVITSSSRTRAAFVSLLRPCTFPHNRKDSTDGAHSTSERAGFEALVAAGGYVVKGDDAEAPPLVVLRRGKDLLPLAVVQLIEAGDVIGAGMLVLRATQTHPGLCTPSAAVVALQAYLVRIQKSGASAETQEEGEQGGAVSQAVQRRCNEALQAFEKMLLSSAAR